jgi:hypothetical protein
VDAGVVISCCMCAMGEIEFKERGDGVAVFGVVGGELSGERWGDPEGEQKGESSGEPGGEKNKEGGEGAGGVVEIACGGCS